MPRLSGIQQREEEKCVGEMRRSFHRLAAHIMAMIESVIVGQVRRGLARLLTASASESVPSAGLRGVISTSVPSASSTLGGKTMTPFLTVPVYVMKHLFAARPTLQLYIPVVVTHGVRLLLRPAFGDFGAHEGEGVAGELLFAW